MRQTLPDSSREIRHIGRLGLFFCVMAGLLATWSATGCDDGIGRFRPPTSCTPGCVNRFCGTDGCGGVCGTCDDDFFCEPVSGLCLGDSEYNVSGTLSVEYMYGDVQSGRVVMTGPDEMPVRDVLVTVVDADGAVLGAGYITDDDGAFRVPVSRRPVGAEKMVVSTVWAPEGRVLMAILDPLTEPRDNGLRTFDPYSWYVDVPAGGAIGQITIPIEQQAGAMFVFQMNRVSFSNIVQPLVDRAFDGKPETLAVIYGPWDDTFVPCTCYQGLNPTWIGTSRGPNLANVISVVSAQGWSSAWGWAVLFHEFGHYVLDSYSKDNSTGGAHYLGQTLDPRFAFSEGWATFMSLVTATLWFDTTWPFYWDIQNDSWFYVDFENGEYLSQQGQSDMVFPTATGSSTQKLDENWVARTLYMLWDESGTAETADASLTLDEMMDTVSSRYFLTNIAWAPEADLYSFLDSALCLFPEKADAIADRVKREFRFQYAGDPDCPSLIRATVPVQKGEFSFAPTPDPDPVPVPVQKGEFSFAPTPDPDPVPVPVQKGELSFAPTPDPDPVPVPVQKGELSFAPTSEGEYHSPLRSPVRVPIPPVSLNGITLDSAIRLQAKPSGANLE